MTVYRIAGDWGTSRLRLFRMEGDVVVDRREGAGIGALSGSAEDALRAAIAPWGAAGDPISITLCGMVGSRNGWVDIPYVECPSAAVAWRAGQAALDIDGIRVSIAAGLACTDGRGVADVMRGEETQIFGAIARDPRLALGRHTVVLPGTHSKWAMIEDGAVTGFRTFPTGEMFALLAHHSTLTRAGGEDEGDDEDGGFVAGLDRAGENVGLLGSLFEARSAQLRAGRSPGWARGFLSGLLIGSEVTEMAGGIAPASAVSLIGDARLAKRYARALSTRGLAADLCDADACALAGLALLETNG